MAGRDMLEAVKQTGDDLMCSREFQAETPSCERIVHDKLDVC